MNNKLLLNKLINNKNLSKYLKIENELNNDHFNLLPYQNKENDMLFVKTSPYIYRSKHNKEIKIRFANKLSKIVTNSNISNFYENKLKNKYSGFLIKRNKYGFIVISGNYKCFIHLPIIKSYINRLKNKFFTNIEKNLTNSIFLLKLHEFNDIVYNKIIIEIFKKNIIMKFKKRTKKYKFSLRMKPKKISKKLFYAKKKKKNKKTYRFKTQKKSV